VCLDVDGQRNDCGLNIVDGSIKRDYVSIYCCCFLDCFTAAFFESPHARRNALNTICVVKITVRRPELLPEREKARARTARRLIFTTSIVVVVIVIVVFFGRTSIKSESPMDLATVVATVRGSGAATAKSESGIACCIGCCWWWWWWWWWWCFGCCAPCRLNV
jgi:hypothetical protein